MILSPSLLAADFANLQNEIKKIESGGAQYVHIDVMDGHFVPNINFGTAAVASIRRVTKLTLDVHLMIDNPEKYVETFYKAGADIVTVHVEVEPDIKFLRAIADRHGRKLAVSVNPHTDITSVDKYLDYADMVLIMTVNPGFGGQEFIADCVDKIRYIKGIRPDIDIEVDGGINLDNLEVVITAGANVIVAGSSVFSADDVPQRCKEFFKRGALH